jgi:hypothetical protein
MSFEGKITMLKDHPYYLLFQCTFFGLLTLIDWKSKFHVVTTLVTFAATGNQNFDSHLTIDDSIPRQFVKNTCMPFLS